MDKEMRPIIQTSKVKPIMAGAQDLLALLFLALLGNHRKLQFRRRAMTNTLLARPCVLCAAASSSSRARNFRQALPFFLQSKKGLVSQCSAVLLDCAAEDGKTKLPIHSDAVVVGPFSRYGKSKFEGGFLNPRRFSTQAANINDAGSIDSTLMMSMEKKIKEQLNAESVSVKDAYGDGRHVSIDVIASTFEGQSSVNRQRMVYKAIWEELQNTVHAVDQMTTKTPDEAAGEK